MINLGNMSIADLRLGASQVKAAYFGSEQIWGGAEPGPVGDWVCFTAEQANSQVWFKSGNQTRYFETSTDGQNWSTYTLNTHISLPNVGDKVYFRAATGKTNTKVGNTWQGGTAFAGSGKLAASGDIKYLVSQDGNTSGIVNSCCGGLFKNMTALTKAPDIGIMNPTEECFNNTFSGCSSLEVPPRTLPATSLAKSCYQYMFTDCTSLTAAPELPATTLAHSCYSGMFSGCSSILAAPALPATTLVPYGYRFMFENCSSLTSVPSELPATTLNQNCYEGLFKGCTSLTSAPSLPATTLAASCYASMFNGCSSLSSVEVAFTEWTSGTTTDWLNGVAATGTFTCPAELPDTRGASNIPEGWTVVKPVAATPLCFTAEGSNASVALMHGNMAPSISMEYSLDNETWNSYTLGTTVTLASKGDKVYFRAAEVNAGLGYSGGNQWQAQYNNYFDCQNVSVSGKMVSVLRKDMDESLTYTTRDGVYRCMLRNYNSRNPQIVSAKDLQLPQLSSFSTQEFMSIFANSTLSAAPALPTNCQLKKETFAFFFENCGKLSSIENPMMTITGFSDINNNTDAPFSNMFIGMENFNQEELVLVLSGIADYPNFSLANVFEGNTSFTGKFILDMTSYTSVPTIQSNTFNNYTKPANGTLEIHVPASLYDTWKNATNWTTWSSYLVPVS